MHHNRLLLYLAMGILSILLLASYLLVLGKVPQALYWDELAIGIDAYAIAKTGQDLHGNPWFQALYPSYGDYKAPIAIWLVAPWVKLGGLTVMMVRLPFLIMAILGSIGMWLLLGSLLPKNQPEAGLAKALGVWFLLTSPWFFHFSHIGFESFLSLTLLIWVLVCWLWGLHRSGSWLVLSTGLGLATLYSYVSARYMVPLFLTALCASHFRLAWQRRYWIVASILIFILGLLPLWNSPFYPQSQIVRWSADTILTNPDLYAQSADLIYQSDNSLLARLIYHRYWFLARAFLGQYLSHFSIDFLGLHGDLNLRHHSGWGGQLLAVSLPLLVMGLYRLFRRWQLHLSVTLLAWLLLAPLTASIPTEVPHASRSIYLLIPFTLLFAWGLFELRDFCQSTGFKKLYPITVSFVLLLLGVNFGLYWEDYLRHYPQRSQEAWQVANRIIGEATQTTNQEAIITKVFRLPALSVLFYNPEYIELVQQQALQTESREDYAWLQGFDRFTFEETQWLAIKSNTLYLAYPSPELAPLTQSIYYYPDGSQALFVIRP